MSDEAFNGLKLNANGKISDMNNVNQLHYNAAALNQEDEDQYQKDGLTNNREDRFVENVQNQEIDRIKKAQKEDSQTLVPGENVAQANRINAKENKLAANMFGQLHAADVQDGTATQTDNVLAQGMNNIKNNPNYVAEQLQKDGTKNNVGPTAKENTKPKAEHEKHSENEFLKDHPAYSGIAVPGRANPISKPNHEAFNLSDPLFKNVSAVNHAGRNTISSLLKTNEGLQSQSDLSTGIDKLFEQQSPAQHNQEVEK